MRMSRKSAKDKNRYIVEECSLDTVLIWNGEHSPIDEKLVDNLKKQISTGCVAAILASGERKEQTEILFPDVLHYFRYPVIALVFDRKLLRQTGSYNEALDGGMIDFELLCRLARVCSKGRAIWIKTEGERIVSSEDTYTMAYVLRRYLPELQQTGKMELLFDEMYKDVQQHGMQDIFQEQLNLLLSNDREYDTIRSETAPFIVFRGDDTCAGVLQGFADELAEALALQGQAVCVWSKNMLEMDAVGDLCKGMVGFQSPLLLSPRLGMIRGKRFQFWLDYPAPFAAFFPSDREDYHVLCQDGKHVQFIRNFFGTPHVTQLPPGGVIGENDKGKERPYDIVFVGSYFSEQISFEDRLSKEYYEYMLANPLATFERGLRELLHRNGCCLEKDEFLQMLIGLRRVYRAVIGYFRRKVIDTILEAGYTIHVYGDSWLEYESIYKEQLMIHPEVQAKDAPDEWGKAKIGLNVMSWHKAGMTERVANIMLSGAVCLTEETEYIRENFEYDREVVAFRLDRLDELPKKIAYLLYYADAREHIAEQAFKKAKDLHTWRARAKELIEMTKDEKKAVIFVATHVKFNPPANPIYIPLQVGREGKEDLGYVPDNIGENISDLNYLFGELTGLFWIWQNIHDMDYVGICHYRRYFLNEDLKLLDRDEYIDLLSRYDVIVPKHAICEGSYYEHYGRAHDAKYLDVIGDVIARITPEYSAAYRQAMEGTVFYSGNLMVTSLPILKAYAEWLFTIFTEAMERIDVSGYDDYHKRIYGFLSEQMLYVYMLKNNLTYKEMAVGISEEKAETRELKLAVKALMAEGKYTDAAHMFDEALKQRPDLLFRGSDLYGELLDIYNELKNKIN